MCKQFSEACLRKIVYACRRTFACKWHRENRKIFEILFFIPSGKTISYLTKADDRTRTDNLLITNQLLCQLSHIGIFSFKTADL